MLAAAELFVPVLDDADSRCLRIRALHRVRQHQAPVTFPPRGRIQFVSWDLVPLAGFLVDGKNT